MRPRHGSSWPHRMRCASIWLAASVVLLGAAAAARAAPRVVVSIAPIHSLAAGVMQGAASPTLLIRGYASPHSYRLRPSQALALRRADLVVWVGAPLEGFLRRPLAALARAGRVLTVMDLETLKRLPAREGGAWEAGHHGPEQEGRQGHVDPHVWLDPRNATGIVAALRERLVALDPEGAGRYRANAARVTERIERLDRELEALLAPVRDRPYLVFHDAYQYLESRYGLHPVGSVTVSPDHRPGARRLSRLREQIRSRRAGCVFGEPQFNSSLMDTILEGTGARRGTLDPLGASARPGPDAYFEMMRANARALRDCLQPPPHSRPESTGARH